jgi:hypothetical protein
MYCTVVGVTSKRRKRNFDSWLGKCMSTYRSGFVFFYVLLVTLLFYYTISLKLKIVLTVLLFSTSAVVPS